MSFYEQDPAVRMQTPNASEIMFDKVFPKSARWGLDHPPFDVSSLPPLVRYAPDRIIAGRFVECKGVGKDCTLKVKLEQVYALQHWSTIMPVCVFIWNSHHKKWTVVDLDILVKACHQNGALNQFPDNNKPAWFIHTNFLEVEWTDAT
jgi:hypothetical protein